MLLYWLHFEVYSVLLKFFKLYLEAQLESAVFKKYCFPVCKKRIM